LREIQGRTTDFVVAADGTIMHGLALIYVLRDLPGIEAFRIVQETQSRTRVMLVPDSRFELSIERRISEGLRARLGQTVDVVVERVPSLPRDRSGKFRYVVSHVSTGTFA
jgi:phenylacetate-CoA ligase